MHVYQGDEETQAIHVRVLKTMPPLMWLALAALILSSPLDAAVRDCANFIDNAGEGTTEKEAKTGALKGWMERAEALGMAQVRWQTADERSLACEALGGLHRCIARARPCVIKQVAPEGWIPKRRP